MLNINEATLNAIKSVEKESENQFLTHENVNLPILEAKLLVNGSINKSNMKSAEFVLSGKHDLQGEWLNYSRSITTKDGTFNINHGLFRVVEQEYKEETKKTHIKCFDEMIKTHKYVMKDDINIIFPSTTVNVIQEVARICELGTVDVSKMHLNDVVKRNEWVDTQYTYRDVLDHIAGVSGLTIQIKNGSLTIDGGDVANIELSAVRSKKLSIDEQIGKFNILNITQEPQHWNTYYPDNAINIPVSDRKEYVVTNNPIADSDRDAYKVKIFNRIKDIEYRMFENDSFGWGIFDVGDKITLKSDEGIIYNSVITTEEMTFKQSLHSKVNSNKPEQSQEEYVVATDQRREGQTVYLLVDQANGKIQSLVEQIGDRTDKTTSLTQDVDSIEAYVRSTAVSTNLIPNLNALMEIEDNSYLFWTFKQGGLRTKFRTKARTRSVLSPTFLVEPDKRSISQFSKRFRYKGTALSGKAYIVPDTVYSYRCKRTNGSQPFTVNAIEYNESDTEVKKTSHTLNGQNTIETFTFTPAQNTMWVRLEFVTSNDNEFNIAEEMFVRGEPVQWNEDTEDIKVWAQSQLKILDDQIILESTRIDKLNGDIHNAGLDINAVDGITVWGKKFLIQNEAKDKDVFKVVTVDGQEQVYMYGSIQSEGGEIAFDSQGKKIKIGNATLNGAFFEGAQGLEIQSDRLSFGTNNPEKAGAILMMNEIPLAVQFSSTLRAIQTSQLQAMGNLATTTIGLEQQRFGYIYLLNQPNVSSDKRLKYNISHIDPLLLDEFEHLERKSFNTKHDDKFSFGYMAQDVERCLYKYIVKVWGYREANNWLGKFKLLNKSESYLSLLYNEVDIIMAEVSERKIKRLEESDKIKNDRIAELQESNDNLQRQMDTLIEILKEKEVI